MHSAGILAMGILMDRIMPVAKMIVAQGTPLRLLRFHGREDLGEITFDYEGYIKQARARFSEQTPTPLEGQADAEKT